LTQQPKAFFCKATITQNSHKSKSSSCSCKEHKRSHPYTLLIYKTGINNKEKSPLWEEYGFGRESNKK